MWAPVSAAASSKLIPALVLGTAGLRFLLTGIYQLSGDEAWEDAAGVVGLLLAALAIYAGWAAELEDVFERTVLPLGRRKTRPAGEPGVRAEL
jgi:succinate-acetate transporter protein